MRGWIERSPRLALTILALLCLVPGTWVLPLMDRDEPRFSHATVEMNERGSWAVPYFNNEYRFDKPPLTYWSMEAGLALFGKTEMGARLHSVISTWLIALVLCELVVLLGAGPWRAFLAGAAWMTCLQVQLHGRLAVADVLLILWVVTAMFCLVKIGRRGGRMMVMDRWFAGLVASLALGFLAKGPLAFAVPALALGLAWLILWRSGQDARPLAAGLANLGLALVPAMALVALWGIPALLKTDGAYFDVGIGKHVVERGTVSFNERKTVPVLYYLVVMIPFLLPWTPLLPPAVREAWRTRSWEKAVLLGWFAAPLVIFSLYSTQLPHYVLPGYPALMVLIALVAERGTGTSGWGRLWRVVSVWLFLILGAAVTATGLLALARHCDDSISAAVASTGVLFMLMGGAAWCLARGRTFGGLAFAVAACVAFWPMAGLARRAHVTVRLHQAVGDPGPGVLRAHGFQEPSLVWYFQRPWDFAAGGDEAALTVVQTRRWRLDGDTFANLLNGRPLVPVDDHTAEALAKLPTGVGAPRYVLGWNPGTNGWVELAYVKRSGD
jgi:4-amino-4-deoxy-L-arabinose transferase-like glycosyltransferase